MHVIADGQIASPHYAAVAATRRLRQIEVIRVHENRIAEIEHRAGDVAELERRIRLGEAHFADSDQSPDGVGVRYPREAKVRLGLAPPPRTSKSFARAAYLVIGTTQLVSDRAIELRSAQSVARMPRQRQREGCVVNLRRVHDDVLSESTLVSLLLLDAGRKDSSPVPVAVLVLPQVDDRTGGFEMTEQDSAVEQIARVVLDANRPRRDEHRVFVVADLHGVDRHTVEESATHVAEVHFALHLSLEHGADHVAHALLAEAGVRDTDEAEDDDQQEPHQHDGARDHDA